MTRIGRYGIIAAIAGTILMSPVLAFGGLAVFILDWMRIGE